MSNQNTTPVQDNILQETNTNLKSDNYKNENSRQTSLKKLNKKKRKKIIKAVIIILILVIVLLRVANKAGILNKFFGSEAQDGNTLTTYTLNQKTAYRTITKVLTSTGTIEPNEQYPITSLVNGEIVDDYFNNGDTVTKEQPLYSIESDSLDTAERRASNNLTIAENSLQDAYKDLENLNVVSELSGIIQEIHVEIGDEITHGQLIADVIDSETMVLEIPFLEDDAQHIKQGDSAMVTFVDSPEVIEGKVDDVSPVTSISAYGSKTRKVEISIKNPGSIVPGTTGLASVGTAYSASQGTFRYNEEGSIYAKTSGEVTAIYFLEGGKINENDIIVRLESSTLLNQIESLEINVDNAKSTLKDAQDAYDNYTITSPVNGKVISKEYKKGDTIAGNGGNAQLAVIYDMSALKFEMNIDELDIDSLNEGQQVIITSDSREGYSYYGTITNISILGTTTNGTTVYPVEVTIENVEDEFQRTVLDDGSISKVYKTGMTSVESTYTLADTVNADDGSVVYIYSDGTEIKNNNGTLYIGESKLNTYSDTSYILSSTVYTFNEDFSKVTVEVRNEKKMLRPGMNIDAQVIVEKRENVIAIPVTALGRGNIVKVLKNPVSSNDKGNIEDTTAEIKPEVIPEADSADKPQMPQGEKVPMGGNLGANAYGTASLDAEFEEVRVTVGISDDEYVEITSGLEIGDVIIVESVERTSSNYGMFGMMGMGGGMGGGMSGGMGGGMPGGGMGGNRGMTGGMPR